MQEEESSLWHDLRLKSQPIVHIYVDIRENRLAVKWLAYSSELDEFDQIQHNLPKVILIADILYVNKI